MAFPEGLPEKKGQFLRPEVRQPKIAYDANDLAVGPGARPEEQVGQGKQPAERAVRKSRINTSSLNVHGLRSKSEQLYPEAYAPVDASFWEGLSSGQQAEVMRLQAVAQEKVGYERGTQKYFIEDFDPREAAANLDSGARLVAIAAPRFVIGGALIGAGLTVGIGMLLGAVAGTEALIAATSLFVIGAGTVAFGSN